MRAVVESILHMHGAVALLLVFLFPALEASVFLGFLVPGEIAALLGGVLAYEGRIALAAAMAAAILGAIIGDSVGYGVGHYAGPRLTRSLPRRFVRPEHIDKTTETIRRLGGKAVFVGRFTATLRAFVPGLCGVSRMPYGTFLAYNVAGGFVWAGGVVLLGYLAGASWRKLESTLSYAGYSVAGVVVVAAVAVILVRRRRSGRAARERERRKKLEKT
jgi:membrane-associated protein